MNRVWKDELQPLMQIQFSSVQLLSHVQLFATPWTAARQASLSIINSQSLLKLMSIESVMPYNPLFLCRSLLFPPSIFPSIRVFSNESVLRIWWPKDWSFRFNISLSNEHLELISFRMDWLDLLAVQQTLKSLLQHHSSKASIHRLKAQHSENEDHGIRSHHFMGNRWGDNGNGVRLFLGARKSLQMVTAAMKLKDAYSLEEKL